MISSYLRGFGQIMLQNSPITGLFFIAGIGFGSLTLLVGALIASFVSLIFAHLIRASQTDIQNGLYGFNAALVGIAVFVFFKPTIFSLLLLIIASIFSTYLFHIWHKAKLKIAPYTAPFIITTWILLVANTLISLETNSSDQLIASSIWQAFFLNIAQVMFEATYISGILFLIGILINSRKDASWVIFASIISLSFAKLLNFSDQLIYFGIYGFNAVLVAIALSNTTANKLLIIAGILLSTLMIHLFVLTGLPALTAPFVLAAWFVLFLTSIKK